MTNDEKRTALLIDRDGIKQALFFAHQAMCQYRRAALFAKKQYGKNNTYREAYIKSYLFHKQVIKES